MSPRTFAKLFEFEDIGQVLVELIQEPHAATHILRVRGACIDGTIVESKRSWDAQRGFHTWARALFVDMTKEQAYEIVTGLIDTTSSMVSGGGSAS